MQISRQTKYMQVHDKRRKAGRRTKKDEEMNNQDELNSQNSVLNSTKCKFLYIRSLVGADSQTSETQGKG